MHRWDCVASMNAISSSAQTPKTAHHYTSVSFTWTNLPYKTFTGRVDLSDVYVPTTLNSYPLAGYWVFFPSDTPYNLARVQVWAMKRVGWIDKGTRLIALDLLMYTCKFYKF